MLPEEKRNLEEAENTEGTMSESPSITGCLAIRKGNAKSAEREVNQ